MKGISHRHIKAATMRLAAGVAAPTMAQHNVAVHG